MRPGPVPGTQRCKASEGPQGFRDGRVPCPGPRSRGCQSLTLHPVRTLGAAPSRLTSLRALLPRGRSPTAPLKVQGPAPHPGPVVGDWVGGGLVLSPRGRRGHPLVPRDRTGTAVPGPIFLTKCYVIKSIECVLRFALFFFFRPTPFSLPCPSHLGLWGLMILFSSHVPAVAFLPRIHLLGEDLLQCVFSSCS